MAFRLLNRAVSSTQEQIGQARLRCGSAGPTGRRQPPRSNADSRVAQEEEPSTSDDRALQVALATAQAAAERADRRYMEECQCLRSAVEEAQVSQAAYQEELEGCRSTMRKLRVASKNAVDEARELRGALVSEQRAAQRSHADVVLLKGRLERREKSLQEYREAWQATDPEQQLLQQLQQLPTPSRSSRARAPQHEAEALLRSELSDARAEAKHWKQQQGQAESQVHLLQGENFQQKRRYRARLDQVNGEAEKLRTALQLSMHAAETEHQAVQALESQVVALQAREAALMTELMEQSSWSLPPSSSGGERVHDGGVDTLGGTQLEELMPEHQDTRTLIASLTSLVPEVGDVAEEAVSEPERDCAICFEESICTRLQPCSHALLCRTCAEQFVGRPCPVCRRQVEGFDTGVFDSTFAPGAFGVPAEN